MHLTPDGLCSNYSLFLECPAPQNLLDNFLNTFLSLHRSHFLHAAYSERFDSCYNLAPPQMNCPSSLLFPLNHVYHLLSQVVPLGCRFSDVEKQADCSLESTWDQVAVKVRAGEQGRDGEGWTEVWSQWRGLSWPSGSSGAQIFQVRMKGLGLCVWSWATSGKTPNLEWGVLFKGNPKRRLTAKGQVLSAAKRSKSFILEGVFQWNITVFTIPPNNLLMSYCISCLLLLARI